MGVSLQIRGLCRHFLKGGQRIDVLRGADLELRPGDSVALLGQSGSGKSTFLHILGALEAPTGGDVLVDGTPLFGRSQAELDRYRNRQVGYVFQFHHLLPDHSAVDNAAMPALIVARRAAMIVPWPPDASAAAASRRASSRSRPQSAARAAR